MTDIDRIETSAWDRTFHPRDSVRATLVCLPHAGGSASFYREWGAGLPEDVEVRVLQYPGREDRLAESCVDDMARMADVVTEVIRPLFTTPVFLFGHSMGASLMYEVTRRCEAAGLFPELLVASGHPAPHRRERRALHRGSDEALITELRRFSGNSDAVMESVELRELLLPMIRADYRLIETYELAEAVPVRSPLAVFRGIEDPDVDADQAEAWRDLTLEGELRCHRVFDGGHFYVRENQEEVLGVITNLLTGTKRFSG